MPTPTIFEGINPRGTQTFIPCKDAKAQNGVIANTKLIKDTVGWSGKNIFDFEGWLNANNNPFTKNADGSYQFWTNNSILEHPYVFSDTDIDIILSSEISYPSSSPAVNVEFDLLNSNNEVVAILSANATARACKVRLNRQTAGNVIVKNPMIRLATCLDPTYEPYFGSTAFPRSEQAILGAKNLALANIATTQTISEMDFTVNSSDVNVVTVNGTNSAEVWFNYMDIELHEGNYIGSGCTNGSDTTYMLTFVIRNAGNTADETYIKCFNGDVNITVPSGGRHVRVYIVVRNDKTLTNQLFKLMIRPATDTDPTYAPYAMTNKELTEQFPTKYTSTGLTITNGTISEGGYCKIGNVVLVNIRLQATETGSAVDIVGLPTYTGANKVVCSGANFSDDISAYAYISSGGHLFIKASDVVANKNYVVSGIYLAV